MYWSNDRPFLTFRESMWQEASMNRLATVLNNNLCSSDTIDGYTLVNVHPWTHSMAYVEESAGMPDDHAEVITANAERVPDFRAYVRRFFVPCSVFSRFRLLFLQTCYKIRTGGIVYEKENKEREGDGSMIYADWLDEWLEYYVKPTKKRRTYEKYAAQAAAHIAPRLGGYALEELTPLRLQKFSVSLSEKGLAPNTVNGILSTVKTSLRQAVALGKTEKEYGSSIARPKMREKRIECFTKEEQSRIEAYILQSNKPGLYGITIALYTGLRIGELLALRWEDVNFRKGVLTVNKTCFDSWEGGKYKKMLDSPKTESSQRLIPLPKRMLGCLKEMQKRSKCCYIVDGRSQDGAEVRSYQRAFESILKRLGIAHKGFHSLRHTFATRALEVGMDVKTLSEILGHRNPTVTLRRYAHSFMDHKAEMMNRVGRLMV